MSLQFSLLGITFNETSMSSRFREMLCNSGAYRLSMLDRREDMQVRERPDRRSLTFPVSLGRSVEVRCVDRKKADSSGRRQEGRDALLVCPVVAASRVEWSKWAALGRIGGRARSGRLSRSGNAWITLVYSTEYLVHLGRVSLVGAVLAVVVVKQNAKATMEDRGRHDLVPPPRV